MRAPAQVDIVQQAGHYPFLDQPLVFLGQVLRQTAGVAPGNATAAAERAAAAAATPVRASSPQQISEWLDQWCAAAPLPRRRHSKATPLRRHLAPPVWRGPCAYCAQLAGFLAPNAAAVTRNARASSMGSKTWRCRRSGEPQATEPEGADPAAGAGEAAREGAPAPPRPPGAVGPDAPLAPGGAAK